MENLPRKVLVKRAWFDAATDSVLWDIKFIDSNKEATLSWMRDEFGLTFNIKNEIPIPHIIEFCKKMEGKTVNVVTPQ